MREVRRFPKDSSISPKSSQTLIKHEENEGNWVREARLFSRIPVPLQREYEGKPQEAGIRAESGTSTRSEAGIRAESGTSTRSEAPSHWDLGASLFIYLFIYSFIYLFIYL